VCVVARVFFLYYEIERRKNGYDFLTKFDDNPSGALKRITVDIRRW
jgi:hypothetical protein